MTKTKTEIVHFDVQGEWFTWMLRHLWIEGNEHKAIRLWSSAFPELTSIDVFKEGYFIQVVSGKKKFVGYASKGMTLEDDNRKCWDPNQTGVDNPSFPLLASWDDVIRLKQDKLYITELEMLRYRSTRSYGYGLRDNEYNTLRYIRGADENEVDNAISNEFQDLYKQLVEIAKALQMNPYSITLSLPNENPIFPQNVRCPGVSKFAKDFGDNDQLYNALHMWAYRESFYFEKKYGVKMFHVSDDQLKYICRLEDVGLGWGMKSHVEAEDPFEDSSTPPMTKEMVKILNGKSPEALLDTFIKESKESADRDSFEPEDLKKTEYTNGYIDTEGNFYGVGFIQHIYNDETFVKQFNLQPNPGIKDRDNDEDPDPQRIIEQNGWIKVSQKRFMWDLFDHYPTKRQIVTIAKLMKLWGMTEAEFAGDIGRKRTLDDALEASKEYYDFEQRTKRAR